MINLILKKGRDKSVRNFHPWIFSGAIAKVEGKSKPGDIVRVIDCKNNFLAYGYYNLGGMIKSLALSPAAASLPIISQPIHTG